MEREPNTDADGKPFTHDVVEAGRNKARKRGIYETQRVEAAGWTIDA